MPALRIRELHGERLQMPGAVGLQHHLAEAPAEGGMWSSPNSVLGLESLAGTARLRSSSTRRSSMNVLGQKFEALAQRPNANATSGG
jgi:hypothetical protein